MSSEQQQRDSEQQCVSLALVFKCVAQRRAAESGCPRSSRRWLPSPVWRTGRKTAYSEPPWLLFGKQYSSDITGDGPAASSGGRGHGGGGDSIPIYFPVYADIADKKVELQSEAYTIQINDEVLMLPVLKPFYGQVMKALRTCGDGACSLHAVWGWPSPSKDLVAPAARARAVDVVGTSFVELHRRHAGNRAFDAVVSSLWGELLLPFIEGTGGLFQQVLAEGALRVRWGEDAEGGQG
jgi:hypothetical protein